MTTKTRKVPGEALCFELGPIEFAAAEGSAGDKTAPIKMKARSGEPLAHWFWGTCVHDMAGFKADPKRVPIDYCHDSGQVIGYADQFSPSEGGLEATGKLVGFSDDDRVAEIRHKSGQGVPYQASISFRPTKIEEVPPGSTAKVNGYELAGPAVIFRKWSLRMLAVCPAGEDHRTMSKFSAGDGEIEVSIFTVEENMPPTNPTPATSAAGTGKENAQAAQAPPPAATPDSAKAGREQFTAELKRFTDSFGAENGAKWLGEGKSFEEALKLHADCQATHLKAKEDEIAALKTKLAAVNRGEPAPVSAGDGEKSAPAKTRFAHLGDNVAKIAGGIKLPAAAK